MSDTKAASANNNHGHSSGALMRRPRFHACQPVRTISNTSNRVRIEAVCASGNTHRYSAKSASTGGGMPASASHTRRAATRSVPGIDRPRNDLFEPRRARVPGVASGYGMQPLAHAPGKIRVLHEYMDRPGDRGWISRLGPSSIMRANDLAHGWQIGRHHRAARGHVFEQLDGAGEGAVGLGAVGKHRDARPPKLAQGFLVAQVAEKHDLGATGFDTRAQALNLLGRAADQGDATPRQLTRRRHQVLHTLPGEEAAGIDNRTT